MGLTNQSDKVTNPRYFRVRRKANLYKAWAQVRENGLASSSEQTRNEVKEFALTADTAIPAIAQKLLKRKFVFQAGRGVLISKKNKTAKRPVVVAPVLARVVQRAILNVVQEIPAVSSVLHSGFNFGGIDGQGFGVPAAVEKAVRCAQGSRYFIRTDIKSFFTAVPRKEAIAQLEKYIDDSLLVDLIRAATDTELANALKFGSELHLFPLGDVGVAQGSSLSPLLCNFLLKDFDSAMNGRGVTCIRYIDDFILFAKDKSTAFKALKSALKILSDLGLDAYNPESTNASDRDKSEHGFTADGFEFLGCSIRPDRVRPSKSNCDHLLETIESSFDEALACLIDPKEAIVKRKSYADSLAAASNIVRGWGNTYSFCSDDQLMLNLDVELTKLFEEFNGRVKKRLSRYKDLNRRRYLGFFCLEDCKRDPDDVGIRKLITDFKKSRATESK